MMELDKFQQSALAAWSESGNRGIIRAEIGARQLALRCVSLCNGVTPLVVVRSQAVLDHWWEACCHHFNLRLEEANIVGTDALIRSGTVNLAVFKTASIIARTAFCPRLFLIVDECHKAASDKFRDLFLLKREASLGLSATPERQYDDGFNQVLLPELGPVIFNYTYKDALANSVIVPFTLINVVFELEEDRQQQFDKATKGIALAMNRYGAESPETIALLLKRAANRDLSTQSD